MAATLQLKYGDLTLDILEGWSESVDWGTEASVVSGSWAGVAFARKTQPRRLTLTGFIGSNVADPTTWHRDKVSDVIAKINDSVTESKRADSSLWQLWFHDDRFTRCRPLSFAFEHVDGMPWVSRFTAQLVAPDPRWYASSGSAQTASVGGTSAFFTLRANVAGDAPTEPRFKAGINATSTPQVVITNRFKNVLQNAMLRETGGTSDGVPKSWDALNYGSSQVFYQQLISKWANSYGVAWLRASSQSATTAGLFQDVKMTQEGTSWSLSARVATETLSGTTTPKLFVRLEWFDINKASLGYVDSSTITAAQTEETLTVLNQAAPSKTRYIRCSLIGARGYGDSIKGFVRWMQLERSATATSFEYKASENLTFGTGISQDTSIWIDCKEGTATYVNPWLNSTEVDMVPDLTAGHFFSFDPGSNELLVEVAGTPTEQSFTAYWDNAWWGK